MKKYQYEEAEDRPEEPDNRTWKERLPMILATLAWGGVGGWVFSLLGVPLAWMVGAMLFVASAAVFGVRLQPPGKGRAVMITVLGVMLGSAFTPDVMDQAAAWLPSIIVIIIFIAFVSVLLAWGFEKFGGMPRREAVLSGTPGGFGEMVLIAEAYGADMRTVSLIHATRVMFTIMVIPLYFRIFEGYEPPDVALLGRMTDLGAKDAVILATCAVTGYFGARALKIPAAAMLGPMIVSAVVHFMGFTSAKPPGELVNMAQVVIGVNVGCRFVGVKRHQLINPIGFGVISATITLLLALGAAYGLHRATDLDFLALWISFSPGGLAEMTLISLAMNIDTAFVSTHHTIRILFIVSVIGLATRMMFGPPPDDK